MRDLFSYIGTALPKRVGDLGLYQKAANWRTSASQLRIICSSPTGADDRFLVYAHGRVPYGIEMHFTPNYGCSGRQCRRKADIAARGERLADLLGIPYRSNTYDLHRNERMYLSSTAQESKGIYVRINDPADRWDTPEFRAEYVDTFIRFAEAVVPLVQEYDSGVPAFGRGPWQQ
jgi:hypothetical protein